MTNDNVVDMGIKRPPMTPEQLAKIEEQGAEKVLNLIDKNRETGLKQLSRAVDDQEERKTFMSSDGALENTIRVLEKGQQGALTYTEATDSLIDMMRQDIITAIQSMQQMYKVLMSDNTQLAVLLEVLRKKNMVSEEEMVEVFKELTRKPEDTRSDT
jgi:hypothetical protein